MTKLFLPAALSLSLVFLPGCGRKGPVQPPLVLIPQPVETLKAFQRGARIVLEWTNPASYIDGKPLAGIAGVEIWMEEKSETPLQEPGTAGERDFASRAKRVAEIVPPVNTLNSSFLYIPEAGAWQGKTFVFAVRVRDMKRRRFSEFSSEVSVKPRPVPLPPQKIQADVFNDRVEVRWDAPEANIDGSKPAVTKGYNVYRIDSAGRLWRLNTALVSSPTFSDRDFLFDRTYRYMVRASASEAEPYLESDDSPAVEVLPKDHFPPAVPSGLSALKGPDYITLIWDANQEKDLAGYNVWRKEEGQTGFVCLTKPPILENTFTDKTVEKNKLYEYAITAIDTLGNESAKSASAKDSIKDSSP
jgi:hypothetical protein